MRIFKKVVIVGTGLIGGSIALGIKKECFGLGGSRDKPQQKDGLPG